jgi:hypothetical protein
MAQSESFFFPDLHHFRPSGGDAGDNIADIASVAEFGTYHRIEIRTFENFKTF